MTRRNDLLALLAIGLLGLAGFVFAPRFLPQTDETAIPDTACDLNLRACVARLLDGTSIEFKLTPRPIPLLKPIQVEAHVEGLAAEKVEIDFAGADMNMGFNRVTLAAISPGRFVGEATLPICVTGRMMWQATVIVASGRRRIAASFRFEAPR